MVPTASSSEVLKLFLAIPRAEIDRDIAGTPDNFDSIWPEIQAYHRLPAEERTPAVHVRLGSVSIALDAAHIRWHQAGGPASEDNGLALCVLHHT